MTASKELLKGKVNDGKILVETVFDQPKDKSIDQKDPPKHGDWEVRGVSLKSLIPTQDDVDAEKVNHILNRTKPYDHPQVLEIDGKLYVIDGHHRITSAVLEGKDTLDVELARADSAPVVENGLKKAAGILFIGPQGQVLLGLRAEPGDYCNHWGIFGGHAEVGETLELTALREVMEETGHAVEGELQLIAATNDGETEFTYFVHLVNETFAPVLNWEHTAYAWVKMGELPPDGCYPLIPMLQEVLDGEIVRELRKKKMDERDIAEAMSKGALPSPQKYANVSMYDMRVTGTGTAFRKGYKDPKTGRVFKDEHVYRRPENYLSQHFLDRCLGLPVIFDHPEGKTLNSQEFSNRVLGSIVLPYIKGDEVWGIAKIYDEDAVLILDNEIMSTSPAVVFTDTSVNTTIPLDDGSQLLIEGNPGLLDHLAVCEQGVWDKGGDPSGIISETARADSMAEEAKADMFEEGKHPRDVDGNFVSKGKNTSSHESSKTDSTDGEKEMTEAEKKADAEAKEREEKERADAARADAEETMKKVADSLGSLMSKVDACMARMDAFEKAKADAECGVFRDDAAHEASAEEKALKKEKEKEARADAAKKAEKAEKEARKAAEKAEEEARADAVRKVAEENAQLRAKLESLTGAIYITDEQRAEIAEIQSRADGVASLFGANEKAPSPQPGESPLAYRKRLATKYKQHSNKWKEVDVMAFDDSVLKIAEADIYADAVQYAAAPADMPAGQLREVVKVDRTGRKVTEFVGAKSAWMNQFKAQGYKVLSINNGSK